MDKETSKHNTLYYIIYNMYVYTKQASYFAGTTLYTICLLCIDHMSRHSLAGGMNQQQLGYDGTITARQIILEKLGGIKGSHF